MAAANGYPVIATISGTGNDVVGVEVFAPPARGFIRGIIVRQEAGGGATAVDVHLAHTTEDLALDAVPPDEHVAVFVDGSAYTPTASATAAALRSPIDRPRPFANGLAAIVDVTAAGAWTIVLGIEVDNALAAEIP